MRIPAKAEWYRKRLRCPHCETVFNVTSLENGESPLRRPAVNTIEQGAVSTRAAVASSQPQTPIAREASIGAIGRFELKQVLGSGSFGTVYRAYDPVLGRQIALKVPGFSAVDKAKVRRFVAEAKSAGRLRHPNIVAVFDAGQTAEGQYFIASEFIDGQPLSEFVRPNANQSDVRTAVEWVRDLAFALAYAHNEGIIHRDVKSANILIDARHARPQLADFGIAKQLDETSSLQTADGSILGTPAYMAPEQARGQTARIGPACDQYSLGIVLYELLAGRLPFLGSPHEVLIAVAGHHEPPPLDSLCPMLSPDLVAIVAKATSKRIDDRYASVAEFGDDLQHWLKGEPVKARPITRATRLLRWARREPALAATSCLVLVFAAVSFIASAWLWRSRGELARALQTAEEQTALAQERKDVAQKKEIEANKALEKLTAEVAARQLAEKEKTAELDRRLKLTDQFKQQELDLRKREAELKTESSGRLAAEATAASAAQERDRVLKNVEWLNYTENLVLADKLLQQDNLKSAAATLQQCPAKLRAWEWHYLNALAAGLKPVTESVQNITILNYDPPIISQDATAFAIYGPTVNPSNQERSNSAQFYQTFPVKLLNQLAVGRLRPSKQPKIKFVSSDKRTAIFGPRREFLWDIERGQRISCPVLERASKYCYSHDGLTLYGIEGDASLHVIALPSGKLSATGRFNWKLQTWNYNSFCAGPHVLFAIVDQLPIETSTDLPKKYGQGVSIFTIRQSGEKIATTLLKQIKVDSRPPNYDERTLLFSESEDFLLLDGKVVDIHSGEITPYAEEPTSLVLALSPDNRRVLSIDTKGFLLRDSRSSDPLPRLASLPWGKWNFRTFAETRRDPYGSRRDSFKINSAWTKCVAIGEPSVTTPNSASTPSNRVVYTWRIDKPISSGN
jgi:hypothetical protein